jgi:signal transduction histidine kinase
LFAGDASLGAVHYALSLPLALTLSGFLGLSATFVLLLILAFVLNLFLLRRVERTMLVPLVDRLVAERRKAAVVEVARMVAHDIRRPFQTLLASLRMLPIESLGPSAALVRRIAADVELNARGVSAMLDDVLSSDGKTKLNLERVEVRGLVESILAEMNAQTVARGVSWSIDVDTKLSFIADPLRMRRALANLIENAGHAVRPNGTAAILANAINEPGTIRIVVSNEGEPIPESVRERLFREPVSTKSLGSGVGLLSTKRVVEAHGGTIRCESEDGETRFIIDLPQPAFAESVFKDDGFSRLVVFDDDESIQQLFRQLGELQVGKPLSIYRDWEAMLASGSFELIEGACLVIDMQYRGSRFDGVAIARQGRRLGAVHLFAFTSDPATAEASGAFDRVYSKDQAHDLMRDLQSLSGKMSGCPVPDNPDNR